MEDFIVEIYGSELSPHEKAELTRLIKHIGDDEIVDLDYDELSELVDNPSDSLELLDSFGFYSIDTEGNIITVERL